MNINGSHLHTNNSVDLSPQVSSPQPALAQGEGKSRIDHVDSLKNGGSHVHQNSALTQQDTPSAARFTGQASGVEGNNHTDHTAAAELQKLLADLSKGEKFTALMSNTFKTDFANSWVGKGKEMACDFVKNIDVRDYAPSGLGALHNITKTAGNTIENADRARRLDNVTQLTDNGFLNQFLSNHPEAKLDINLTRYASAVLAEDYGSKAEKHAINMTVNTIALPLSGIAGKGVLPLANESISNSISQNLPPPWSTVASTGASLGPSLALTGAKKGGEYAIAQAQHKQTQQIPTPTLEFNEGKVSLPLDKPGVMEALLKYLGPKKDESALSANATPEERNAEQARLDLRQRLGCPDDCDLGSAYQASDADKVIKKLLTGSDRRLSTATSGAMMNIKNDKISDNPDARVLQQDFAANNNHPNFLKIINIAADWVKPD